MARRSRLVWVMVMVPAIVLAACGGPSTSAPTSLAGRRRAPAQDPPAVPVPTTTTSIPPTATVPAAVPTTTTTVPAPATAPGPGCAPSVAQDLASTGGATQLVTVVATAAGTTVATLTAWQLEGSCWVTVLGPWTATIGAAGFSDHHREGDDTTPTGAYGIGPVMYGNAPDPGVQYQYHQLSCGDWWDEDPTSPGYNTFEHVPCGTTPPFGGASEPLWEDTVAYPSFAVIDYNTTPVVPGAGSGIFLHANITAPTDGCVSLPLTELDQVLTWLDPGADPLVVMGPSSEIDGF